MAVLDVPGADVVGHAVSEDVVAHIFLPDMERVPAQDNGQLHLIIQLGDKIQMAVDRLPIAQGPEDIRQAQSLPASSELYLRPMDKLIQTAGSSALPVLIQGAVGTHKGVVARRIHTKSATEGTTLMRLQCRDLTEKNWDMLLNNAASPIHATGYTVYLENVDTLPKDLQQQVGTYIEDTKMTHRHRVISSSCCDLSAEVARGQFSSRLYLQLSGFTINVPSLAQRKEDIPAFVNMMIPQYNTALAKSTVGMEPDAMELMVEFEWPLNLVQLEKVLRQMIAASSGFYITAAEVAAVLQNEMRKVSALPPAVDLSGTLEDIERRVIEQVLREVLEVWGDRQLAAARELTKLHEEFFRGTVSQCLTWLHENKPRGEFCLVIARGLEQPQPAQEAKDPLAQVQELLARGVDKKTALAQVAKANKIPKRELYNKLISEEEGINI